PGGSAARGGRARTAQQHPHALPQAAALERDRRDGPRPRRRGRAHARLPAGGGLRGGRAPAGRRGRGAPAQRRRDGGQLPPGRQPGGNRALRARLPRGRGVVRELHPGVHRLGCAVGGRVRAPPYPDRGRRRQVAARGDHRSSHAGQVVRRSRRRARPDLPAEHRRQHGLLEHAEPRAHRRQAALEDRGRAERAAHPAPAYPHPHRSERLRPLEAPPAGRPGTAAAATLVIAITVWLALRGVARISMAGTAPGPAAPLVGPRVRAWYRGLLTPLEDVLVAARVHPDALTGAQLAVSVLAGAAFWAGWLFVGGWLTIVAGTLDVLDGGVARRVGVAGPRGALVDSLVDRCAEFATFVGLGAFFRDSWVLLALAVACFGSFMV